MIKVGITGQEGFTGSHLFNFLGTKQDEVSLITFQRTFFEDSNQLTQFVASCDVIVHFAAMNRHENPQVIYDTNVELTQKLIDACQSAKTAPKIIFSSSTQEELDNLYGKSKKKGRELLEKWALENKTSMTSLIIPNVFGPFGKPFYNSFIATFCHQVINNQTPTIHQDSTVNLIYVNELIEFIYNEIIDSEVIIKTVTVPYTYSKTVSETLNLLTSFNEQYVNGGVIPNISDAFSLSLFNTFTSFIPKDYFPRKYIKHSDNRGSFVEITRANTSGQSSFSTTVPGITRGNHYHTRKVERFAVVKGKALIQLRKVNTDIVYNYELDGNEPAYVDMPIWYTHNIKNIGDSELITMFWINEPYNPEDPDTYFQEV